MTPSVPPSLPSSRDKARPRIPVSPPLPLLLSRRPSSAPLAPPRPGPNPLLTHPLHLSPLGALMRRSCTTARGAPRKDGRREAVALLLPVPVPVPVALPLLLLLVDVVLIGAEARERGSTALYAGGGPSTPPWACAGRTAVAAVVVARRATRVREPLPSPSVERPSAGPSPPAAPPPPPAGASSPSPTPTPAPTPAPAPRALPSPISLSSFASAASVSSSSASSKSRLCALWAWALRRAGWAGCGRVRGVGRWEGVREDAGEEKVEDERGGGGGGPPGVVVERVRAGEAGRLGEVDCVVHGRGCGEVASTEGRADEGDEGGRGIAAGGGWGTPAGWGARRALEVGEVSSTATSPQAVHCARVLSRARSGERGGREQRD
ncbi:hypothetical protein DMC30DRAFT_189748 [Rhodotorula diobovata]|uniref:Uncharacterized protein n=1 Tax=Rhodotorula diobovata TaxID=5288 RepID=A0A5C5G6Y7_9BASI|nr:hypothetical protein DMC30DRAFT_189748 [Rhodotorula diobovata]